MKRFTPIFATSLLVTLAPVAAADTFGAGASATYWHSSNSGSIQKGNGDRIDLKDDLDFDDEDFAIVSAALEHPVPVLPNIRFQYFSMDQAGAGTLPSAFGDITDSGAVTTNMDLSHYDFTFYYEVLDNWVNLDAGLTAKLFDGQLTLRRTSGPQAGREDKTDIDVALPLVYAHARFDLPASGLSAGGGGNFLRYDGDTVYDLSVYLNYRIVVLDLQAGYREMRVDVDDIDDVNVDAKIRGPFFQIGVSF